MSRAREFATQGNNAAVVLNSSAASTDVGENLLLEGTDSSSTNAGYHLLQEKYGTHTPYDQLPRGGGRPELTKDTIWFRTWFGDAGNQAISHNTTTVPAYDKVFWDYNNNANMAADPNKFTVTVPGIYWFKLSNYLSLPDAHNSYHSYDYSQFRKNGTKLLINNMSNHGYGGGSGFNMHNIGTINVEGTAILNIGDYIEPIVYQYKVGHSFIITTYWAGHGFTGMLLKRLD